MPPTLRNTKRYVPPSVYIHGAKLSAKIIALIVILVVVTSFFSTLLCYICIKRRKAKNRRRQREKEERENKQLKPRINQRNARFYAPGLGLVEEPGKGSKRRNEKGWEDGLRGKVDRGVLERWNKREKEYRRDSESESGSVKGSLDRKTGFQSHVEDIEMRNFGHGHENGECNVVMSVKRPERAWVKWTRK